ncbi:MAG: SMC-Scp complex subunit ScpB [Phycisphaerae bacterium]|nr:SMC-Scp complex subunit ScpB [Phycisphaerae bacterium]
MPRAKSSTTEAGVDPTAPAGPESGPSAGEIAPAVEAVLLTLGRAVPPSRLGVALGLLAEDADEEETGARAGILTRGQADRLIADAVDGLNEQYERTGRSFRIEQIAGGYRMITRPEFAGVVSAVVKAQQPSKLSKPAVETLAIVAYRQPITRAELEAIRGVSCGEVLKTLMDKRLVTIKGRAEEVGRPILYGTTKQFLDQFGFSSVKDLPTPGEAPVG